MVRSILDTACSRGLLPRIAASVACAFLVACGDAPGPTSLRNLAPRETAAGDVQPSGTEHVGYNLQYGFVALQSARILSVSKGNFSGITATVPPGANVEFVAVYSTGGPFITGCPTDPCPRTVFLAYTAEGLPAVEGLQDTYNAHGLFYAPGKTLRGSTTAPSEAGTYFIGLRDIPGSTRDDGPGVFGFDMLGKITGPVAPWEIVVIKGPFVTPTVTGTLGKNGWYTSDVKVTWSVDDPNAPTDSKTGCDDVTITSDGSTTLTCTATSVNGTNTNSVTIKRDATPPLGTSTLSPERPNAGGWYNTAVTLTFVCTDATSGFERGGASATVSGDNSFLGDTEECEDKAGNRKSYPLPAFKIDVTPPTLTGSVSPNPVALNGAATATPVASDARSGLASATCDAVTTSVLGAASVKCSATDNAGNTTTIDVPYFVAIPFSGFLPPINGSPTAWNAATAGSAIELLFNLGSNKGMSILASGSPAVRVVSCPGKPTSSGAEQPTSGPGLKYDGDGVYKYVWKTDKALAGKCATFVLKLTDGVEHTVNFQFK